MHERLVLFSQPSPEVFEKLKVFLFPEYVAERVFAYMPSDGANKEANTKHTPTWKQFAEANKARFVEIDNSKRGAEAELEAKKLLEANVLVITGGNTYTLLDHLKKSGLDKTIINFWKKGNVVLAGFSAGAQILSPSIENAKAENLINLTDTTGLNLFDFEVWPHYDPSQEQEMNDFQARASFKIRTIANDECLVIDK